MNRPLLIVVVLFPAAALAQDPDELLAKQLAATLRDPRLPKATRVEATKTLAKMGQRASPAVPELIAQLGLLRGCEQESLQEAIIEALGQVGSPARSALPMFARSAGRTVDIDQAIKRNTTLIVGASDAQDIDTLVRLLASRDPSLRLRAAKALGVLGPAARVAIPDLIGVLADPDGDVRRAAILALRLIQPDARPGLAVARSIALDLADADPSVRAAAARALGRLGSVAVGTAPALEALLADPDGDVRRAAADALARVAR